MKNTIILSTVLLLILAACTSTYETKIFNDDEKPSSPLQLVLNVTTLPNSEMEITANIRLIDGFSEQVAPNVTFEITLPSQLELIEGKPGFVNLDISQGEVVTRTIKVRAVGDGEGVVDANAVTAPREGGYYYGDNEKFYVYVTDNKIRIRDSPFSSSNTNQQTSVRIDDGNPPETLNEDSSKVPRKN